ncbi:hypothetical protein [Clostridium sp. HBUAS56017]|uniref:hypothetical protein n=1 Tax=Clostridium sp. HBUAS56017 TaxID=2571128 RepID=UPI001177E969|nr:hypothetical protein [Clostridium sp. HBUAS56017]
MKVVMNHEQFLQWKYNNRSELDIQFENITIDKRKIIFVLGVGMFVLNNPKLVMAADLSSIDVLGNKFLDIIRKAGYWIILAVALTEIIRTGLKGGGGSEVGKAIIKYLLIFSSLYVLPTLFNMVREAF